MKVISINLKMLIRAKSLGGTIKEGALLCLRLTFSMIYLINCIHSHIIDDNKYNRVPLSA